VKVFALGHGNRDQLEKLVALRCLQDDPEEIDLAVRVSLLKIFLQRQRAVFMVKPKLHASGIFDAVRHHEPDQGFVWSRYLPESAKGVADWTFHGCAAAVPSRHTRIGERLVFGYERPVCARNGQSNSNFPELDKKTIADLPFLTR
jgi:hypothetical protein